MRLTRMGEDYHASFAAMATPCEIRVETDDPALARELGLAAQSEALRIEHKFSRYRSDSVVGRINAAGKDGLLVDAETAQLLDFAQECHAISRGMFDVTSGVFRRAWRFDGSDALPDPERVKKLMPLVGWRKVSWKKPHLRLKPGMEIDLGGLAKEYAVDLVLHQLASATARPVLVNFGGDLRVSGPRNGGQAWHVAIESVEKAGNAAGLIQLTSGALATSGDARRFLLRDGVRYRYSQPQDRLAGREPAPFGDGCRKNLCRGRFDGDLGHASRPRSRSLSERRRSPRMVHPLTLFGAVVFTLTLPCLSDDLVGIEQALITEASRSELGESLRTRFIQPQWRRLAAALDREMVAGHLRKADPMLAAWHFRGLVEADLVERRLHGDTTITDHEIKTAVDIGVDVFLRGYSV
jgi:thiamine biosynthesis lipoprotein